ncbi:MAG: pyruvate formate-lyase 1-activating enzyme, partial [Clostridia bacterium]|nr:pyruvate formate-lyase 1-activating enzyme [Clostridia bacterium]
VIIPTLNDNEENILRLKEIRDNHKNIVKTEFLPFKKLCSVKYDKLGIDFKFKDIKEPTKNEIEYLEKKYKE